MSGAGANGENERRVRAALRRAQLLLSAAEDLADAPSVVELRNHVDQLIASDVKPARVELFLTQDLGARAAAEDRHDPTPGPDRPTTSGQWNQFDPNESGLIAQVVRENRLIHHADLRSADRAGLSEMAARSYLDAGLRAVAAVPISGVDGMLGVLEFVWDQPHEADPAELAVIVSLAGYVGIALQRARRLQSRIAVARELQDAMLSELPRLAGLDIAARYRAATDTELVGGDWYDAFPLPLNPNTTTPGTGEPDITTPGPVALVVGDVTGHDIHAATGMGQLRAMLRQTCWDHQPEDSPAAALTRLDHASHGLGVATGTAILAYLHPLGDGTGRWSLTWSNAGHPPPVLIGPDRGSGLLHGTDPLLGFPQLLNRPRRNQRITLRPGATLLLYTDGLIERRGHDLDTAMATLARHARHPTATAADHVEHILTAMTTNAPAHDDDIAVLAVRIR
ncbi:PP2C family protein-serine/threonine phosphatase [Actinokineospora sp. 24-640]